MINVEYELMISSNFMDFEVVGLGGWRREQIKRQLELQSGLFVTLTVHKGGDFDQSLFAAALIKTQEWLKPAELKYQIWPLFEWQQQLLRTAVKSFPLSFAKNPEKMHELIRRYNEEKPLKDLLLVEHYCYLPLFVHQKKIDSELEDIIKFEVTRELLEIRDFGERKINPGSLHANNTLDIYDKKNVKALYVHPKTLEVIKFSLQSEEARILDLLEEGIELDFFNLVLLIEQMDWGREHKAPEWRQIIAQMMGKGLILTNS